MSRRLSRLERHRRKQSNRQAVVYIFLSIVFVAGLIRWGIPALISIASWWNADVESTQETRSTLKPQAPVLDPLPEATYSASIKVSGYSLGDMRVRLQLNGMDLDEKRTDSDGRFEFSNVSLSNDENRIELKTVDDQNNESDTTVATVVLDTSKPVVEIASPDEEHQFYGLDQKNLEIQGKVDEPEDRVTVNDNFAQVDSEGNFVYRTVMSEGANDYVIRVVDSAGNVTERLFRVFYTP